MWCVQPSVGECDLRYLDLPGVLGEAPRARSAPQVSALPPLPLGSPRAQHLTQLRGPSEARGWRLCHRKHTCLIHSLGGLSNAKHLITSSILACSFVRSVTMDKWKDIELEKMKAGGNAKFRQFLASQEDYDPCWSLQDKYNSKAAALFRDKVRPRVVPRPLSLDVSDSRPCTDGHVALSGPRLPSSPHPGRQVACG